jgi:hypothetical protein
MRIPRKVKIGLIVVGVLALVAGWQEVSYLLKLGYSKGSRTGVIRKVSVKGRFYCKYLEGELALQGGAPGQMTDTFVFSADDPRDQNPIVQQLHEAERNGTRITLNYRQDGKDESDKIWWRCNPNQYFIVGVEK